MTIEEIHYNDAGNTPHNIDDKFFNMTTEQIKNALKVGRSPMVNICMNLTSDFNKSSVIRSNNAFLGREVIIVGKKRFDRRGTVGAHHYETVKHSLELAPVAEALKSEGYTIYAVDNTPEFHPQSIYDSEISEKAAFVYGEEQRGLSADEVALCDESIYIPQYGSVRSINVAQAAAVTMSEYNRRHKR
jgi:tRNA G18 (ribose-2'-O)-methylase SpoU